MNEKNIKICLAQMEVIPGQPQINCEKVISILEDVKGENVDLVVFPEMCIPGYIVGDMWERMDFLEECERATKRIIDASRNNNIHVAFGNIWLDRNKTNEDGRVRKYNTCFVTGKNGTTTYTFPKTLQPNYREFDDNRHFYDNRKRMLDAKTKNFEKDFYYPVNINGINCGFMLCEDGWDTDYTFSPVDVLAPQCDLIVNISCSPFTMGKNNKRNRVFSEHAKRHKIPIIYVNNVGVQNNGKTIYTFDGDSCIYDCEGHQLNPYERFEEKHEIFSFKPKIPFDKLIVQKELEDDISTLYQSLIYGIEKFISQLGIKKVVIGASGGIDSAVVSALFSKVMSPDDMYLVNMPSEFNSETTKDLAYQLAKNIGCHYYVIPIGESIALTQGQLDERGLIVNQLTFENIQARDRSSRILAAIASSVGGVFTCNANKSEMTVGYTTMYGDLGGFMAPLADVWKTDVYKLASYINEKNKFRGFSLIPDRIMALKPSAELSEDQNIDKGKGDPLVYGYHDKLFASWVERWNRATPADILQWYRKGTLEPELGYTDTRKNFIVDQIFEGDVKKFIEDLERWWNLYDGFSFAKRIQAPPVLAVSRRAFGFDLRETQTPPYYSSKYLELKKTIMEDYEMPILKKKLEDELMHMSNESIFTMAKICDKGLNEEGFVKEKAVRKIVNTLGRKYERN